MKTADELITSLQGLCAPRSELAEIEIPGGGAITVRLFPRYSQLDAIRRDANEYSARLQRGRALSDAEKQYQDATADEVFLAVRLANHITSAELTILDGLKLVTTAGAMALYLEQELNKLQLPFLAEAEANEVNQLKNSSPLTSGGATDSFAPTDTSGVTPTN